MAKITLDMLQEDYWKDMKMPQLVQLRQAIEVDTANFQRGMRGVHTVEEYALGVPELTVRMNAINKLTELIAQRAPTYISKKSFNDAYVHCPKCWRGVRVNEADCVPAEAAYLWGVVQVYGVSKTLDLRCRQCKGIRWRR
mgnify:CR=1 FL=1